MTEFDNKGNKTTLKWIKPDGSYEYVFRYKINDLQTEELEYDGSNNLKSRQTREYDENHLLIRVVNYTGSGKVENEFRYRTHFIDARHYTAEKFDAQGKLDHIDSIETDAAGHIVYEYFGYSGIRNYLTYKPNTNLVIKEVALNKDGTEGYTELTEYDGKGNVVKMTHRSSKYPEEVTTYKYVYDAKGNWIKQISRTNDGIYINERIIEYYQ